MVTCGRRGILLAFPAAVLQNQPYHRHAPVATVQGRNLTLVIFFFLGPSWLLMPRRNDTRAETTHHIPEYTDAHFKIQKGISM